MPGMLFLKKYLINEEQLLQRRSFRTIRLTWDDLQEREHASGQNQENHEQRRHELHHHVRGEDIQAEFALSPGWMKAWRNFIQQPILQQVWRAILDSTRISEGVKSYRLSCTTTQIPGGNTLGPFL